MKKIMLLLSSFRSDKEAQKALLIALIGCIMGFYAFSMVHHVPWYMLILLVPSSGALYEAVIGVKKFTSLLKVVLILAITLLQLFSKWVGGGITVLFGAGYIIILAITFVKACYRNQSDKKMLEIVDMILNTICLMFHPSV